MVSRVSLWIVAYDSPSDKRRRRIAELLEGYGQRLQWSVFECHLRDTQIRALRCELERRMNDKEDRISMWPVASKQLRSVVALGLPPPEPAPADYIC
jgi:CRISPR-associated protein Cas2